MQSANQAVTTMLDHMTDKQSQTHFKFASGDRVALMVNNLGGTSVLELNIVAREAIQQLEERGVKIERAYCATLMTSLEMAGVSIGVLHLDDMRRLCLDAPTTAPGWFTPLLAEGETTRLTPGKMTCPTDRSLDTVMLGVKVEAHMVPHIKAAISNACQAIIKSETELNKLDTQSGDGDCGFTLKRGADAILQALNSTESLPTAVPHRLLISMATLFEKTVGGTSGALYSIFLTAAAAPLATDVSIEGWCNALGAGIAAVQKYGGAEPGDRTMVDPLHAAHDVIKQQIASGEKPIMALASAVKAAKSKAVETAKMQARAGRASYVDSVKLTQPDPGAHAVGLWLNALYEGLRQA